MIFVISNGSQPLHRKTLALPFRASTDPCRPLSIDGGQWVRLCGGQHNRLTGGVRMTQRRARAGSCAAPDRFRNFSDHCPPFPT